MRIRREPVSLQKRMEQTAANVVRGSRISAVVYYVGPAVAVLIDVAVVVAAVFFVWRVTP